MFIKYSDMRIEYDVEVMLDFLHNNNVKVYLVGGFVRDTILNRYSKDYDIAVDKPVIEIIPLLRNAGYTVIDKSYFDANLIALIILSASSLNTILAFLTVTSVFFLSKSSVPLYGSII